MNTTTLETNQVPAQLNQLIFGDRNTFIFITNNSAMEYVTASQLDKFLCQLDKKGYAINNAHVILTWTIDAFKQFKQQLLDMLKANTKEGMILRNNFAKDEKLQGYTHQDWLVILAQYSITYSWSDHYTQIFGLSAEAVLANYVDSMSAKVFKQKNKTRVFKIGDENSLTTILRDIVESPAVLRSQQLKTLEQSPAHYLAQACTHANIKIKETLIKVMTLVSAQKLDKPILKTASDVVRFVLATSVEQPFEGQITKDVLKKMKHRIPTRMRKALLNNMEAIAASHKEGVKFLTEDMLSYENYWQRLDKHLRFTKAKIMRARFPNYTQAIDLLYTGDRSWTFNGRVSAAKSMLDYDTAVRIMAERPGVLMRNIIEFLRMTKGKALPVKAAAYGGRKPDNAFLNALMGNGSKIDPNLIKKDASAFFKSEDFVRAISHDLNTKLAWQLIEQLRDKSLYQPVSAREVQGKYIEYTTPIPGIDPELAKTVRKQLLKAIKRQLGTWHLLKYQPCWFILRPPKLLLWPHSSLLRALGVCNQNSNFRGQKISCTILVL